VKLRITYNAPVILTFTIAAIGLFIVNSAVPSTREWTTAWPYFHGTASYVGLVGHILGHQSWEHLLGNFMVILLVGPILEERYGSGRLLVMILVTALITGLINATVAHTGLLGASGVAFMMILLASMANVRGGEIPLTFIAVAVVYLGGEIVQAVKADDGVSHMAHLIGGAIGAGFGFIAAGRRGARPVKAERLDAKKLAKLGL
jgi:rhomboid protease GluP